MAAAATSDDFKGHSTDSSLKINASLTSQDELNVSARDTETKRLFQSNFTHDQCVETGFPRRFTMKQIEAVVKGL